LLKREPGLQFQSLDPGHHEIRGHPAFTLALKDQTHWQHLFGHCFCLQDGVWQKLMPIGENNLS
jgi:hypothetical protein